MEPNSPKWTTVSDSPHDHEREALAFLRRMLPDAGVYGVWSNFELVALSGAMYEVDVLAVTQAGVFLIEIKSHPGRLGGDGATWLWTPPDGRQRTFDNPRVLARRKAQVLADRLRRSPVFKKRPNDVPFVTELVFLSDPNLQEEFAPAGRFNVHGRDADQSAGETEIPASRARLGGIVSAITSLEVRDDGRPKRRIDRPTGERLTKAIGEIGIRERSSRRQIGDFRLGRLLTDVDADLDTGIAYQDFEATHVAAPDVQRRIRVYPLEHNATTADREAAARAAKREFELLAPLRHPNIAQPLNFTESDRGPALVFAHDPDAQPLQRWLTYPNVADYLTPADRLDLVRIVMETVRFAHDRGITHRALAPSAVLVAGKADDPRVQITNWHAGARIQAGESSTRVSGTVHAEALSGQDAAFYRAPEFGRPEARPTLLDVFSLGALATLIFTGRAPAETRKAYTELLTTSGCLSPDAVHDAVAPELVELVEHATQADPAARCASVADLLSELDIAEEFVNLADGPDEPAPDEARRGDVIGGGRFVVERRLGSGSTAIALEVLDAAHANRRCVLKAARDPSHNERLAAEAAAIASLRHDRVVELYDGPIDLAGHAALVLSHAGTTTLAARLADQPGAELAERFGADLLDALRHLEERGISHRDIKPENIGIAKMGPNDTLHAVLFDFSLADAPIDRIEAGTQGYVDPFLKTQRRGSWDLHAERYAAAVTLFELTTGMRPRYGDAGADPAMTTADPVVEASMFDSSAAEGLVAFFTKALARNVDDRFGTADDMARAWRRAFEASSQPAITPTGPAATATIDIDGSTAPAAGVLRFTMPDVVDDRTPLAVLGLSRRALNALERQDIVTAGALLAFPLSQVPKLRGVGSKTRDEIRELSVELRQHMRTQLVTTTKGTSSATPTAPGSDDGAPPADGNDTDGDPVAGPPSLSALADALVPVSTRANQQTQTDLMRFLLGWPIASGTGTPGDTIPPSNADAGDRADLVAASRWPSQPELAELVGVTRARVSQLLAKAATRWLAMTSITEIRSWLADELDHRGGVATLGQLADSLARLHAPAGADSPTTHRRAAGALVRAAIVAEGGRSGQRWALRRRHGTAVLAREAIDDPTSAQQLLDFASALATAVDGLIGDATVLDRSQVAAALRSVDGPAAVTAMSDADRIEIATDLNPRVAVNARLALYPVGLPARHAIALLRRTLVAAGTARVSPADLADKVRLRFPHAAPLPGRPELDALLSAAQIDLQWDDTHQAWVTPEPGLTATSIASSFRRAPTDMPTAFAPVEIDVAADFEARLGAARTSGGLLVLSAPRNRLSDAVFELGRLDVAVVDLDAVVLARLDTIAAAGRPSWDVITRADAAGPGTADWTKLAAVLDRVFAGVTDDLVAMSGTVVLHNLGLLARYDRMGLVAAWRDELHAGTHAIDALWLVTAGSDTDSHPAVDGRPVGALPHEHLPIPTVWLANAHRAGIGAPDPEAS